MIPSQVNPSSRMARMRSAILRSSGKGTHSPSFRVQPNGRVLL